MTCSHPVVPLPHKCETDETPWVFVIVCEDMAGLFEQSLDENSADGWELVSWQYVEGMYRALMRMPAAAFAELDLR